MTPPMTPQDGREEIEVKLSREQIKTLSVLRERGGEALKNGCQFWAGGWAICYEPVMLRMERKAVVALERVGESVFATITDKGRRQLDSMGEK